MQNCACEMIGSGDANADGIVDLDDFIILKQNYGIDSAKWPQGDFNRDSVVNLDDFIILKQNYGRTSVVGFAEDMETLDFLCADLPSSAAGREDISNDGTIKSLAPELSMLGDLGSQAAALRPDFGLLTWLPLPIYELV